MGHSGMSPNRHERRTITFSPGPQVRAESSLSLPPKFSDDLAHLSKTLAYLSKANLVRHPTSRTAAIGTRRGSGQMIYEKD
jgi:hypothetical protein